MMHPDKNAVFSTSLVEMVFPNQTNHYGTLFGGQALQLMDKIAFITASRCTRKPMVTVCSEPIKFIAPVKNGDLVEVIGTVTKKGTTSLTVAVKLFSENLLTGKARLCAEGDFVLVAIDENNKPISIND